VDRSFCMDRYEASRADATEMSAGRDGAVAVSAKGVMPWQVQDNATATEACRAAGKALCTADQWYRACSGSQSLAYCYGNTYDPLTCNGIDTFCHCDTGVCAETAVCPYPHCYGTCGAAFRVMPTGSFVDCVNVDGIYDLNGNLWEHVADGDDRTVRGGAFNCMNSQRLHQCTYVPGNWTPSARGFRCCSPGTLMIAGDTDETSGDGGDAENGGDA
jgi:formylglycine-generating enzyme